MKITANEIKPGMIIEHKNDYWNVLKTQHVKPGKGGAFNQVELKSVVKGTKLNERFRSNETVEKAEVEEKKFNFLYIDGENCHFMDNKTFEQVEIPKSITGEKFKLLKENLEVIPRVLPFLLIVVGVLYVLYGGVATPSEASGVGAFLVFVMIAIVYKIYQPKKIWNIVKVSMKESVMIMFIIAASYLFAFTLSQLYVTQSLAQSMVELSTNKLVVFILINIFLLIAGFFLPPVAVIVMTSAILLPVITTLGFDPYWFAIVFTINMEIGLITPPVGLNLYIIKGITPDVSLSEILKGSIPFMIIMALAILILCIFPEIVTWLPDKIMGKALGY